LAEFKLEIHQRAPDDGLIDQVAKGLNPTVPAGVSTYEPMPLTIVLTDDNGERKGALTGQSVWDWFYVNLLWVDDAERGKGLGQRLMQAAETEAEKRGCIGVWVSTYSFQAPVFYEKMGYASFGQIDGFPKGHTRHFYQKRLDQAHA
jgi:GNAT superfamily N-acetyltransferase